MDGYGRPMYDKTGRYIQPYMRRRVGQERKKPRLQRQGAFYGQPASLSMARSIGLAAPKVPKPELKFFDLVQSPVMIQGWNKVNGAIVGDGTGSVNYVAPGPDSSQRIGKTICIKSFQLRWQISTGAAPTVNRVLAVMSKNNSLQALTDFLNSTTNGQGLINLNNSDQFQVLIDHYPQRDQGVATPLADTYFRKMNHEATFVAGGNNGFVQGAIYLFFFCTPGTINIATRTRYYDA